MPLSMKQLHSAKAVSVGSTSAPTRTANTFAVLAEMTTTVATGGGDVEITFIGTFQLNAGDSFNISIFQDGTEIASSRQSPAYTGETGLLDTPGQLNGIEVPLSAIVLSPSAGSHVWDVRWAAVAGTARAVGTERSMASREIPT